jgi:hypothetical protein
MSAATKRRTYAESILTPEDVVAALERAGTTLLRLPTARIFPAPLRAAWPSYVRDAHEAYGYNAVTMRPATPQPGDITAMDQAFSWASLIPPQFPTIRQIVLRRSLVRPAETIRPEDNSDPHIWGWTRLAKAYGLHADGDTTKTGLKQVQRAHQRGVWMILDNMDNI